MPNIKYPYIKDVQMFKAVCYTVKKLRDDKEPDDRAFYYWVDHYANIFIVDIVELAEHVRLRFPHVYGEPDPLFWKQYSKRNGGTPPND